MARHFRGSYAVTLFSRIRGLYFRFFKKEVREGMDEPARFTFAYLKFILFSLKSHDLPHEHFCQSVPFPSVYKFLLPIEIQHFFRRKCNT